MKELIEKLKLSRSQHNELKTQYRTDLELFKLEHEGMLSSIEYEELNIAEFTDIISQRAIKEYNNTGTKTLYGGIGIRVMQRLEYNPTRAIEWAKKHSIALMLDKKAFEKIAKIEDISFVTKKEVPIVTIPREL